ncbi:outer membrane lipoprotein-sorting protein [Novispirillum itersonii]|uniref:outer membrane lipoprotein-sorting protein n=1 Tax=Novispirillum itersonii TaxID=189 RepID=UPI0012DCB7EB|nr:outer membrane lipoprotein-sorting protein [Novispirillum itersonii]
MRRVTVRLVAIAGLMMMWSGIGPALSEELSGQAIMDEVSRRHDRPYEREDQKMQLVDARGNIEDRQVRRYAREGDGGLYRYVVVFDSPAGVAGVALLTWQNKGADDDQWMYLPAYGREMKRTAKGGKRNYFMGTDFAFEDMTAEDKAKFRYDRQPDAVAEIRDENGQVVETADSFVLDAYPVAEDVKEESGYQYRRLYIRKDIYFIQRVDFFDRRGRFIKSQHSRSLVNVDGQTYRADITVMDNEKEKHRTIIRVQGRDLNEAAVPAGNFEQRWITTGRHLKK